MIILIASSKPKYKNESERLIQGQLKTNSTVKSDYEKWKEEYEIRLNEEKDKLCNGYYNNYRYIEFDVAGIYYRTQLAKDTINSLDMLCEIHLIKEPNNPYDSNAIKVIYDRKHLGYVPKGYTKQIISLIDRNLIEKVYVIDAGKDEFSTYSDGQFITLRIYYTPSKEEIEKERNEINQKKEEKERNIEKMQEPIELPDWIKELGNQLKTKIVVDDENKWELKKLKDNIRNSIKSYENATRFEKHEMAEKAERRLKHYRNELNILLKKNGEAES